MIDPVSLTIIATLAAANAASYAGKKAREKYEESDFYQNNPDNDPTPTPEKGKVKRR